MPHVSKNRSGSVAIGAFAIDWLALALDICLTRGWIADRYVSLPTIATVNLLGIAGCGIGFVAFVAWSSRQSSIAAAGPRILSGLALATVVLTLMIVCPWFLLTLAAGMRD
jgi:hypothetical protein